MTPGRRAVPRLVTAVTQRHEGAFGVTWHLRDRDPRPRGQGVPAGAWGHAPAERGTVIHANVPDTVTRITTKKVKEPQR